MGKLAGKKKANSAGIQDPAAVGQKFSKGQILASAQYANRRDLADALLEDGRQYAKKEVDALIDDFMKRKVG